MILANEFNDSWNYTFIIVALVAIAIGTLITLRKMKKQQLNDRREKRGNTK